MNMNTNTIIINDIDFNYDNIMYDYPIKNKNAFISALLYKIDNKKKNFLIRGPPMKFIKPKKDTDKYIYLEFLNLIYYLYKLNHLIQL